MRKKSISPKGGAPIMGFYSPGMSVDVGDSTFVFVTGQIARHEDGAPVAPGDFKAQTEFIFQKIEAILHGAGASIDDVVKAVIYTTDISRFKDISEVRNKYFAKAKPTSTLVEISNTVRKGCEVEIEVIAIKQKGN
ncbi:MAG: RidA family protein [bacterium]|nr:RidA family protein [bacterium]